MVTVYEGNSFPELVAIFAQEKMYKNPCANEKKECINLHNLKQTKITPK